MQTVEYDRTHKRIRNLQTQITKWVALAEVFLNRNHEGTEHARRRTIMHRIKCVQEDLNRASWYNAEFNKEATALTDEAESEMNAWIARYADELRECIPTYYTGREEIQP